MLHRLALYLCVFFAAYIPSSAEVDVTFRFSHLTVLLDMYSSLTQSYGTMSPFLFNVLELEIFLFLQPHPSPSARTKHFLSLYIYICIPRIIISLWAAFISYYWCAKNQIKRTGVALLMARYYYAWDVLKF